MKTLAIAAGVLALLWLLKKTMPKPTPPPEKTFPAPELSDGQYTYWLVRPARKINEVISEPALYERVPRDAKRLYTPDLAFTLGQTTTPLMQPVER